MTDKTRTPITCSRCGAKLGYWSGRNWSITRPFTPPPKFNKRIINGADACWLSLPRNVRCEECPQQEGTE